MCKSSGAATADAKRDSDAPKGYIGRSLVFYAQYHGNPVNIAIHIVFVPVIIFSAVVLLSYLPSLPVLKEGAVPEDVPAWLIRSLDVSAASLLLLTYVGLYSSWDPVAGLSWAVITAVPLFMLAQYFQSKVEMAWAWALGLQVLSWYMQIHPGHLVYEKRKPALLDGLVEAFLMAPLFVWLDVLFALGYRPALKATVEAQAREARQQAAGDQTAARAKAA